MWRNKETAGAIWSNIIGLRPTEEWIRTSNYSKGPGHNFEDPFIDEHYLKLTQTVDPNERQRLARAIGDHLFEEFADMPRCCCIMRSWPIRKSSRGGPTRGRALAAARISIC